MNVHSCVPIKLYLQKQVVSGFDRGCSLLTLVVKFDLTQLPRSSPRKPHVKYQHTEVVPESLVYPPGAAHPWRAGCASRRVSVYASESGLLRRASCTLSTAARVPFRKAFLLPAGLSLH